jgi:hypothetical protein
LKSIDKFGQNRMWPSHEVESRVPRKPSHARQADDPPVRPATTGHTRQS